MKNILIIFSFLFIGSGMYAQHSDSSRVKRPANSVYMNLLADASLISINYERLFPINTYMFFCASIGVGYNEEFKICIFGPCAPARTYRTIPHRITFNVGKRKNFFEIGMGGTSFKSGDYRDYVLYPIIGYRRQPLVTQKFNFRVYGQFPFFKSDNWESDNPNILFIPLGLSFGLCF